MLFYLLLTLLVLAYLWIKWNYNYWKRLGVPGPKPTFLVGNLGPTLTVAEHFGIMCRNWYNQFQDVPYVGYYKILNPGVMVRDPELVKEVLVKNFPSFQENDFAFDETIDPLLAHNPFLVTDDKWRESRALLSPLFTTNKVKYLFPLIKRTCDKLEAYLGQKGPRHEHNSKDLAARFTTENVISVSFSIEANCFSDAKKNEFREMGKAIFQPALPQVFKMICTLFCPLLLKVVPVPFLPKIVDAWMRNLVNENVRSRQHTQMPHDDLLQMLINLRKVEKHITDEQLAGHSLAFFTEGYETSSTLLCFALYELAMNPDIQDRLRIELKEAVAKSNNELDFEVMNGLQYLDGVMHETLRLHPPALTLNKLCTKDFPLPGISSSKPMVIKKGTPIIIPLYALHMDPAYFPDPDCFDPTRHNEETKKTRPKCVFLPFGEGPRMCMGMRFALGQTKAALATMVMKFQISLAPSHKPFVLDPASFLYDSKDGIMLNFESLNN
jgi:cytochrome P450